MPDVKIVKFVRLNTIKAAISSYRGRLAHKLCGISNSKSFSSGELKGAHTNNDFDGVSEKGTRNGTETDGQKRERDRIRGVCNIPNTVNWTVNEFVAEINIWQVHTFYHLAILHLCSYYLILFYSTLFYYFS